MAITSNISNFCKPVGKYDDNLRTGGIRKCTSSPGGNMLESNRLSSLFNFAQAMKFQADHTATMQSIKSTLHDEGS